MSHKALNPRIFVMRGGAVGDFILTLPVFQALREKWPESEITLASYPRIRRLILESGLVDRFESLDSPLFATLFAKDAASSGQLNGAFRDYDIVLSYLHDKDGIVAANLAAAGAGHTICASPIVTTGHAADVLFKPLSGLGITHSSPAIPSLRLKPSVMAQGAKTAAALGARVLMIHPGSGSASKNWPVERYGELSRQVRASTNLTPVFHFGEADDAERQYLAREVPNTRSLSGLNLADLAAILGHCAGYIGNDSGISHLAAAVGIPTVALFGPTSPAIWGQRGPKVLIIRATPQPGGDMRAISVSNALEAITIHIAGANHTVQQ